VSLQRNERFFAHYSLVSLIYANFAHINECLLNNGKD